MRKGIKLRWTPVAVDTLIELEERGLPHLAERVIHAVAERLTKQPGICREVKVAIPGTRRRTTVRRLYLGRELPYLVYFFYDFYDKPEEVVEVIRILHVRQKPIER